nr:TPM domain-containing protein [uncultured Alloprevotella sp.]
MDYQKLPTTQETSYFLRFYATIKSKLLLLLLLIPFFCRAEVWTPENLPMPYLQNASHHVCNPDGVLSLAIEDSINQKLVALEQTRGVQAIVVAVGRVENADAYQFGMNLARKYGIGSKKQNTGLVIVLATKDRKFYILTGEGLEGTLPDAICSRVENRIMKPLLRKGDWDNAMLKSVDALVGYMNGDESLEAEKSEEENPLMGAFVAIFIGVLLFAFIAAAQPKRKCPNCGKRQMRKVQQTYVKVNGKWRIRTLWRCSVCGHTEYTHEDPNNGSGNHHPISVFPPFFGGGLGSGSGGGGGFSGGSFGGGSFGGGGAGGSF